MKGYTKADLINLVSVQLENLNAIHDLLILMKQQTELIKAANKKLEKELSEVKLKLYPTGGRRKAAKANSVSA